MPLRLESIAVLACAALAGCNGDEPEPPPPQQAGWKLVHEDLPAALLSVWGTSASDVWMVGADVHDGSGPMVLHYDGSAWERIETGLSEGELWWVFGFEGGPIYMGGKAGLILRYEGGSFTTITTPTTDTVFGIWGASPDDLWAVGGEGNSNGFAWRLQGDSCTPEPSLPSTVPTEGAIWKVHGRSAEDAWLVGSNNLAFHWDGTTLTPGDTGVGSALFTVHANSRRYTAVGGFGTGVIVEDEGAGWEMAVPAATYGLAGVCLREDDTGFAVGEYGLVYARSNDGWSEQDHALDIRWNLHACWNDPSGGMWSVGGETISALDQGLILHKGGPVATGGI